MMDLADKDVKKKNENNPENSTSEEKEKEVLEDILEDLESADQEAAAEDSEETKEEKKDSAERPEKTDQEAKDSEAKDSDKKDSNKEAQSSDRESKDGKEKKSIFHTDKSKDAMKEKIDGLEDQVRRQMAEFDNFRKRSDKEKQAMFEIGAKSVIEKMLPIVDNFERGLATIPEEEKGTAFADGMEKVYKQLVKELDDLDVKPIEAVGKEFNPEFHNAVMQVQSDQYESGVVAQELQKGYTYHDAVVRHSMVAVVE